MDPKHGGSPLPRSPICLPGDHLKATQYVEVIQGALKQAGWSGSQRRRLRGLLRLWTFRAEGRDQEYEKNGSFGRAPGAAPPTSTDATVEYWRRLIPQSPETRRRRRMPSAVNEFYREKDRYR